MLRAFLWLLLAWTILYVILTKIIKKFPRFGVRSRTFRKERVQSKAEKKVADFLYMNAIAYEYEKTLSLGGKKLSPDFYLPAYDVYIEYRWLPRMKTYNDRKNQKLALYKQYGINVIGIEFKDLRSLHTILRKKLTAVLWYTPQKPPFRTRFKRFWTLVIRV